MVAKARSSAMPRKQTPKPAKARGATPQPPILKGWQQIADFLGQPVNVAQRWGRAGMPVRREKRYTVASPADLSDWLARESGSREPVHIVAETDADLSAELKRSLSAAKRKP